MDISIYMDKDTEINTNREFRVIPQVPNLHHKIHPHFPTPVTTFSNVRHVGCFLHPPPEDTKSVLVGSVPTSAEGPQREDSGVPPLDLAPGLHGKRGT